MTKLSGQPAVMFGTAAAVEQGSGAQWSYFDGQVTELRFRGPATALYALFQSYQAVAGSNPTYDQLSLEVGNGMGLLLVKAVEDGNALYELFTNKISRVVHAHPYFTTTDADGAALTGAQMVEVYTAFDTGSGQGSSWVAKQKALLEHLRNGVEEADIEQFVLRRTYRVSKRSTVQAANANVLRVEDPPSTAAVNSLIGELPQREWRNEGTHVVQIGGRRWGLVTEWTSAQKWSKQLYGGTWDLSGAA